MAVSIEDIKKLRAMTGAGLADVKKALTEAEGDFDKAKETGLTPAETDNGSIAFEQSRLTLECRKLYKDSMTAEKFLDKELLQWYGAKGGFHDVYVVEITNVYKK